MNGALAKCSSFWTSLGSFAKQRSKPGAFTKQVVKVDGKIITTLSERSLFSFSSISSNRGSHYGEERGKEDEKKKYKKKNTNENNGGGNHLSRGKQASAIQSSLFNTRYETRTTSSRKITMLRPPFSSPFPFFSLLSFFPLHNQGARNLHGSSPGNTGFGPFGKIR